MIIALLLAAAVPSPDPQGAHYRQCVAGARSNPAAARAEAAKWATAGGGALALECAGVVEAAQGAWPAAAAAFEAAASAADRGHDAQAATYWAQAGNAWLASGNPAKAHAALDRALAGGLTGLPLGEAQLDQARALVAAGELAPARRNIDLALANADADPLAWLLSATLARRMGDLPRARADIAQALARSANDASVQLEAGNIAATDGDEARAKLAWAEAARLAPFAPAGRSAMAALRQFEVSAATSR